VDVDTILNLIVRWLESHYADHPDMPDDVSEDLWTAYEDFEPAFRDAITLIRAQIGASSQVDPKESSHD
jgi:hypothetical protein